MVTITCNRVMANGGGAHGDNNTEKTVLICIQGVVKLSVSLKYCVSFIVRQTHSDNDIGMVVPSKKREQH